MIIKRLFSPVLLTLAMMLPIGSVVAAEKARVPENRVIYEVFVRNFSPEGNFKGVEAQIPRLKKLGVDVVWLMPIYKLGDIGKWGSYSSPYAIKDYKAIDPDNGSADDLRSLISTIHDNGMEIWFDWVGNHTSKDNVWVSQHPEYYGDRLYSPNGWNDVYQLDVNNAAMHEAMIDAMQYWVSEFDIDGYRCDYASGPSEDFWRKATSRVLKNGKRIAWLAEDDSRPELVSKGYFDYNYAWAFHDRLMDQARGVNLNNLRNECARLHSESAYKGRSRMVYLTNHDVVQDKGGSEDRLFGRLLKPMTVLQFTVYGMPLLYNGQEIQYKTGRVSLAEKTPVDWSNPDTSMTELITTLASLKHSQPALRTGSQSGSYTNLSTSDNDNIMAYRRSLGDNHVVVALNYSDSPREFTFSGNLPSGVYKDVFSGKTIDFSNPGSVALPASGYAVFIKDDGSAGGSQQPELPDNPDLPDNPSVGDDSYCNLYVRNLTGWNQVKVYAWAASQPELYGGWPGTAALGGRIIDGNEYLIYELPESSTPYNFIFSNNGSDSQKHEGLSFTPDKDTFVTLSSNGASIAPAPSAQRHTLYIGDNTGWTNLYVYAWADGQPEFFGPWPGTRPSAKVSVNGADYLAFPFYDTDVQYNLIFTDGSKQYDATRVTPDHDIFIIAGPDKIISESTSSVDNIDLADISPVYYNLNGMIVDNPANGIFIEVRGTKVSKVVR